MVNILLQGALGRMGQTVQRLVAERDDCRIVAGVDIVQGGARFPVYQSLGDVHEKADVLVDFSIPDVSRKSIAYCADTGLPCIICTTGLSESDKDAMKTAAEKTAVFYSANMSLGINLLKDLARRAQKVLKGFDIEIVERHHHNKLDAPSGTALALADAINEEAGGRYHYVYDRQPLRQKRDPDEIGLHAVRGGSIVGDHEVIFAGPDEVITLSHSAHSREVFAHGAIAAALFLAGKAPGLYDMEDLMGVL